MTSTALGHASDTINEIRSTYGDYFCCSKQLDAVK